MIEYMLIVTAVVVVLILALGPGGFGTRGIGKAINILMVNRIIDPSPGPGTGCGANCASNCTGSGFQNALACPGDETNVSTPTPRTLVPACTDDGTDATKCQYTCDTDGDYVLYGGGCCHMECPSGSCGYQTSCGTSLWCGDCCGNGVIDTGEQCDPGGNNLNNQTCQSLGRDGGILTCNADCTFNTSGCCDNVAGTWGGNWNDDPQGGGCGGSSCGSCQQRQRLDTCIDPYPSDDCSAICPDPYPGPWQCRDCGRSTGLACCGDGYCDGLAEGYDPPEYVLGSGGSGNQCNCERDCLANPSPTLTANGGCCQGIDDPNISPCSSQERCGCRDCTTECCGNGLCDLGLEETCWKCSVGTTGVNTDGCTSNAEWQDEDWVYYPWCLQSIQAFLGQSGLSDCEDLLGSNPGVNQGCVLGVGPQVCYEIEQLAPCPAEMWIYYFYEVNCCCNCSGIWVGLCNITPTSADSIRCGAGSCNQLVPNPLAPVPCNIQVTTLFRAKRWQCRCVPP